jgi:hypothetical protein
MAFLSDRDFRWAEKGFRLFQTQELREAPDKKKNAWFI